MTRVSPLVWTVLLTALAVALYAATHAAAVFWLARSMAPTVLAPAVRTIRPPGPLAPLRGVMHTLHPPTHGGAPQFVLRDQEPWQRSAAADACVRAAALHRLCAQRYADMSPAARAAAGGDVLGELPGTLATLRWAQHPADGVGVDDGNTPVVETARAPDGGARQFAFVKARLGLRERPQVVAALQHVFRTPLQRAQIQSLLT